MQLMESFTCDDGSQVSVQEIGKSFESPDTTFIMLDDGQKIAGRNIVEGWRMIAVAVPGEPVYLVTLSYINRVLKFSLAKPAFYGFVLQRFDKILKEA